MKNIKKVRSILRKMMEIGQPIARYVLNYCNVKYHQFKFFIERKRTITS